MLSKLIIVIAGSMIIPNIAHSHPHHPRQPTSTITVSMGWTWVKPTVFRTGHWNHPHYGRSFRSFNEGPPGPRPQLNAVWVPGHWERRGRKKVWIPGHWRR